MGKLLKFNKELNKIRALIVENFVNGEIRVVYNKNEFEGLIKQGNEFEQKWGVTKIYEPTLDDTNKIIEMMLREAKVNKENKIVVKTTEQEVFAKVLPILTDCEMDYDLDNEEDYKEITEIVSNPPMWLAKTKIILRHIIYEIINNYVEDTNTIKELPEKIREDIFNQIQSEEIDKAVEIAQNKLDKELLKELEEGK